MGGLSRRSVLLGAGGMAVAGLAAWQILLPEQIDTGTWYTENGVAIRGTDPVAYFSEGQAVAGSADHAHEWAGAIWHFATASNRDAFAADPMRYAPQYGGYCAWAVAAKGELYSTQPENWAIVDGRLFLNFNDAVQDMWNEDRPGFIVKGDRRWPELAARDGAAS